MKARHCTGTRAPCSLLFHAAFGPGTGFLGAVAASPPPVETRDIYTPSRLNREARTLLERGLPALWLEGEISNLSRPSSGHWYFSLKDEAAQLRCAMFRQRNLHDAVLAARRLSTCWCGAA